MSLHLGRRQTWPERGWYRTWLDELDALREQVGPPCSYADLDAYLWIRGRYDAARPRHDVLERILRHPTPEEAALIVRLLG